MKDLRECTALYIENKIIQSSFQTICIVLWVSNYCGSVLRPLKSSLQKKKKKKKEVSAVTVILCYLLKRSLESVFMKRRIGGNVGRSCLCAGSSLPHSRR